MMNKGLLAGCVITVAAAGLGYWIWSDAPTAPERSEPALALTGNATRLDAGDGSDAAGGRAVVETIDLSRVFDPTGEELDLQNLLEASEPIEFLPTPRIVDDASSPISQLRRQASLFIGRTLANHVCQWLPLKGAEFPSADAEGNRIRSAIDK